MRILRKQLRKCAVKPVPGRSWEMGFFTSSLCVRLMYIVMKEGCKPNCGQNLQSRDSSLRQQSKSWGYRHACKLFPARN